MANPTTIIHKIANAVLKIGTANGTKIAEPDYTGEDQSNEGRSKWYDEWKAISEALVASTAAKAAKGREEKAKESLKATLSKTIAGLNIGDKVSVSRGNVSVLLDLRSGQSTINKEAIISTLRTDYKWDMEEVIVFLEKITKVGAAKLYTTYSSTQE